MSERQRGEGRAISSGAAGGTARATTIGGVLRRVPFTLTVVVLMLVLSVVYTTLWTPIEQLAVYPRVAFGLPALEAGRWGTVAFGAFFALVPVYYLLVAGGFALLVGFAEYRMGTGRTVVVTIGGHLAGVLGCALFLLAFRDTGWPWAARIATMTDVGFSAGMMAAICVASATVAAPWGLRIRLAAIGYVVFSLLYGGLMADIEHGIAVLLSCVFASRLAGPHAVPQARASAREWHLLLGIAYAAAVLGALVVRFVPGEGPTGSTPGGDTISIVLRVCVLVVGAVICVGLFRGSRFGWAGAVGLAIVQILWSLLIVGLTVANDRPSGLFADAPLAAVDGIVMLVLLIAAVRGRWAFDGSRGDGRLARPVG